jgi:phosphoribosylamine--glycine ligase
MERIGILVISYGSREAAIIDAFTRSLNYKIEIYVVDRQKNPFNVKKAKEHIVISDLNINDITKFVKRKKSEIDFGIVGPEKPIIDGIKNVVENETDIPLICPSKEFAIEASKVVQRHLFQKVAPNANPRFKIFNPKDYSSLATVKQDLYLWLDQLQNNVAVKPDRPAAGKGVGVWGDHFTSRADLFDHFIANYQQGPVIVEEKIDGEESSFQAFCDGRQLTPLPETRDNKRAFDEDKGPNTGGMGSYKDAGDLLPFMTAKDKEQEINIINRLFNELRKQADRTDLLGVPFYGAFIHSRRGPKLLENNSRPGDPEIQNILPILKDDFVDICYKILEGNLSSVNIEAKATVVTYKVPPSYGGYVTTFQKLVKSEEMNTPVDLSEAEALSLKHRDNMRIYPGSMETRDNKTYALSSRAICVVGIGENIQKAREISLEGIKAIKGGALWHRNDIASKEHLQKSLEHMNRLRQQTS